MYLSDLHIHSRFSRATSRGLDAPHLDWWARRKGIRVIGTGDFTHPAWRAELKEQLVPAGEGLYRLRDELRLPGIAPGEETLFLVTGEISSIYKRAGKTRKVHNVILLPSLEAADELSARLEAIGNIHSDGRPILGLDSRDLLELTLNTCPDAELIPAHIWTPHFSMFGAFSDFSSVEECFDDMTPYIHAVETGLSSDPPMNWRVSALDGLTLVSHSDAHSPAKLGREANLMETELSYPGVVNAIRTGDGFWGTIEFFPEEGKYHLDGHRNCGVCLTPSETQERGGLCPVCGRKLTVGVEHRVEELADREEGYRASGAKPCEGLAPLPEAMAATTGFSAAGKRTAEQADRLVRELGTEFYILRQAPVEEIERVAGPCIAEGIRRLRAGQVERRAGFDGEYGTISLLTPSEIERFNGQISLFGIERAGSKPQERKALKKCAATPKQEEKKTEQLNPQQMEAVSAEEAAVAVIAGPGTGKTKTLVARIAYLIEERGVRPEEITAVTFTNQATEEMRGRLERRLGGKRAAAKMTIGTFHAICMKLLGDVRLITPGEALTAAAEVLRRSGDRRSPRSLIQAASQIKNGISFEDAGLEEALYRDYCRRLQEWGALDFDDLLIHALRMDTAGQRRFTHLLVDEFQDINAAQYALVRSWSRGGKSLFVIGDPDQSIYGFRGAQGDGFRRLREEEPGIRVIRLIENYRSTPEILNSALPVIEKNPGEPRVLSPNRRAGIPVRLVQAADDFSEAVFVAKEIGRMTGGIDMLEAQNTRTDRPVRAFSDIAVLCRTHRQLELIEKCLRHDDIPCIVTGREEFLEADEVRGALAFFQSVEHPDDSAALETALRLLWNCPEDLIRLLQAACRDLLELEPESLRETVRGYGHLELWLERAAEWKPSVRKEKPHRLIERWEKAFGSTPALERLRNTAVFYSTMTELWNMLALGQEADLNRAAGKNWRSGAVRLMTLHGSKGLEFPAVFLSGLRSGVLPLEVGGRMAHVEEERRLFYVGMTRAREELILTCGAEPSAFVRELPGFIVRENAVKHRERPVEQLTLF